MRVIHRLAMICAGISIGGAAHAELIVHKDLSAQMALTIAETALTTCTANSYHVSVTGSAATPRSSSRSEATALRRTPWRTVSAKPTQSRTFRVASGEIAETGEG